MKITIASTLGFCEGVKNALNILLKSSPKNEDIYLLSPLVHNSIVNQSLLNQGYHILDSIQSLEEKISSLKDVTIVFSAHGHDEQLDILAKKNNLKIIDTTCQRVKANFISIKKSLEDNYDVIYIGITNHPETIASLSISNKIIFLDFKKKDFSILKKGQRAIIHNQTTLLQDELNYFYDIIKKYYPEVKIVNDICLATKKRQQSLSEISDEDIILILGDKTSSNTNRLYELAKHQNPSKEIYFANSLEEVKSLNLDKEKSLFLSAGASTPREVIDPIVDYLKNL